MTILDTRPSGKGGLPASAKHSPCQMLIAADHDYIAARLLLNNALHELGLFHIQQAVEKYMKAFLISRKKTFKLIHDLDELRQACANFDPQFFNAQPLADMCKKLTDFSESGRYPSVKIKAYTYTVELLIDFIDHLAFEIRQKIAYPDNCRDDIEGLSSGKGWLLKAGRNLNLTDAFFLNNSYFHKS